MSRQIRSWIEVTEEGAEEPTRWNLLINEHPVPDGYVAKVEEGFEIHYPHLTPKTLPTLEEAKRHLELAPPISNGHMKIARLAKDDSDLISSEEAGEMLGVSRFRVNAMVASGVLAGRRTDGRTLVDRRSVEKRLATTDATGPRGQFANLFLFYQPVEGTTQYVTEIDSDDVDEIERAKAFVKTIMDTEAGTTELRTFSAMRSYTRNHRTEFLFEEMELDTLTDRFAAPLEATLEAEVVA